MTCGARYSQLNAIEDALRSLRTAGIGELSPVYRELYALRGQVLGRIGQAFPKPVQAVLALAGLSPGTLRVFFDVENGWLVEARSSPGAPPVYHLIPVSLVTRIIQGELTHEEFESLKIPEEVYEA